MGVAVKLYDRRIENHLRDDAFLEDLAKVLEEEKTEVVFSLNFFPLISEACRRKNRKYISWIFSCPHYSMYCENIFYNGNYLFCFDRVQYQEFKQYGVENVYHLPLASDSILLNECRTTPAVTYNSEVSFVGTLYTDERNYFDQFPSLPAYIKGYLDGLCEAQMKVYGSSLAKEAITQPVWEELKRQISFHMEENYFLRFEQFLTDTINKRVTILERRRLLEYLGRFYETDVYTGSDTSHIVGISNRGYVNYYDQMPMIFQNSKVNLNITLRSILSGIPLRVMDVLACGGFLLTNIQPEILEYFDDGVDLAVFTSMEEAADKCGYYLTHEEERQKIALRGHNRFSELFTYDKILPTIFSLIK